MESNKMESRLLDFDSDVSTGEVLKKNSDDLRAERRAQLIMKRMAERRAQLEKERRAEEMAQQDMKRMAEEIAQLRMKRRADEIAQQDMKRMVKRSLILEYPHHLSMDTGSLESIDSGVSLKSDQSKDELFDFKDRVSPRWVDSFLSEKKHNVTYVEDWIKSSDSQMAERRAQLRKERRAEEMAQQDMKRRAEEIAQLRKERMVKRSLILEYPHHLMMAKEMAQREKERMAHRSVEAFGSGLTLMNDSFFRPRQRSLPRMVLKSMEACGSSLSLMNDSFIRTGQRSPPREEMNQELSSEVGWKHN